MKDYIEKEVGVDPDEEPLLFETLDEAKLGSIIQTQKKSSLAKRRRSTARCTPF